jgi:protein-ribulosamine 3-kinase
LNAIPAAVSSWLETTFQAAIVSVENTGAGDINEGARVTLGARALFVKWHRHPPPGHFDAEADGLARLAATGRVRVPEVLGVLERSEVGALALAAIDVSPGNRQADTVQEEAGRMLASLHGDRTRRPGLPRANFIGRLGQDNGDRDGGWVAFYREARLGALSHHLPVDLRRRVEGLALETILTEPEGGCALLHGDLWAGNLLADQAGRAWFIDPAVYYGHPEVDLAMSRLFGGFSEHFYGAYREVAGAPAPGMDRRVDVYMLYPLMVHVALFGSGYLAPLERTLARVER